MIAVGILWIFAISYTTANDRADVLPTFSWGSIDPAKLIINFNDGGDPGVVNLKRVHSEFVDDAEDEKDDTCILIGNLVNETDSAITVDGCPGNETFQVILSSKRIADGTFEINNGTVTAFHMPPDMIDGTVDDEIEDDRDLPEMTAEEREISDRSVPSSFGVTLAIGYDNNFLKEVGGGDKTKAKKRVKEVVALAQTYFLMSATLGTKITLKVKEIKHVNAALILRQSTIQQSMGQAGQFATNHKLDVDNYHFFSQDSLGGIAGVARKGTLCDTRKMERVAITEFVGTSSTKWDTGKLAMAQTFAHELGHSLNMPHDFKGQSTSTARKDSSGKSCLTVAGMMSYKETKTTWSTCSKEALAAHFKIMQAGTNSKIKNCKKGSSGGTATTTTATTATGATTKAPATTTKATATGCSDALPSGWGCGSPCATIASYGDCDTPWNHLFFCFQGAAPAGKVSDNCKKSCGKC